MLIILQWVYYFFQKTPHIFCYINIIWNILQGCDLIETQKPA